MKIIKIRNLTKTEWKDLGDCWYYFLMTLWEIIKILLMVSIFFIIAFCLIFGVIRGCQAFSKDVEEESKRREQYKSEMAESFKMQYAGKEFYKFNMEGHEYWYVDSGMRGGGLCHSETCPCHTNKVEVVE